MTVQQRTLQLLRIIAEEVVPKLHVGWTDVSKMYSGRSPFERLTGMFGWGEGMGAGQRMQPNAISLKIKSHFCISKQSLQFHSGLMTCKAHRSLMAGLHQNTERQNKGKKILLRKDRLSSSQVAFLNSLCFLAESLS